MKERTDSCYGRMHTVDRQLKIEKLSSGSGEEKTESEKRKKERAILPWNPDAEPPKDRKQNR